MGQIRRAGNEYYIEFYARGLMYSQLAGSNIEHAQQMLDDIEAKIAKGELLTIVREIDLTIFYQKFLEQANGNFSLKSLRRFSSAWDHWLGYLKDQYPNIHNLSQITPSVLESYKIALSKAYRTKVVNLTLLLLREIFEYGIKIGFINDNPTLHISLLEMDCTSARLIGRGEMLKDLLSRGVSLAKIYEVLNLKDVAQIVFWSNFIPLKRQDVYN